LKFKEPANLTALPDSARDENQLIELIFSYLPALSIGKPEEEDHGQHYTPVSERNALRYDLVNADEEECCR
jgi:hypothetical protein